MTTSHHPKTALPTESTTPTDPMPKKPAPPKRTFASPLLFGLSVAALLGAGGAIYQTHQITRLIEQQKNNCLMAVQSLQQQVTANKDEAANTLQTMQEAQQTITTKIKLLNQAFNKSAQQQAYQSNDWLLLKVRYYLELAQINAHWSDQAQTTAALLQEADDLLNAVHDERLFAVRQAIAKEINELKATHKLDMVQLLSQLDALQQAVLEIPIKKIPTPISQDILPSNRQDNSTWSSHFESSLKVLEKLVVIQHHENDIEPIFSQEYESVLRENIRLGLQEAQWALLRLNKEIYDFLLQQAITNVKRSFDIKSPKTITFLQQLTDLQKVSFVQATSSPKESLILLNQLLDEPKSNSNEQTS